MLSGQATKDVTRDGEVNDPTFDVSNEVTGSCTLQNVSRLELMCSVNFLVIRMLRITPMIQ
jgi:hypothetical protein